MRDTKKDTFLGDGLYAGYEPEDGMVVLYAHNGLRATDTVYLEPQVLAAFIEWAKSLER